MIRKRANFGEGKMQNVPESFKVFLASVDERNEEPYIVVGKKVFFSKIFLRRHTLHL